MQVQDPGGRMQGAGCVQVCARARDMETCALDVLKLCVCTHNTQHTTHNTQQQRSKKSHISTTLGSGCDARARQAPRGTVCALSGAFQPERRPAIRSGCQNARRHWRESSVLNTYIHSCIHICILICSLICSSKECFIHTEMVICILICSSKECCIHTEMVAYISLSLYVAIRSGCQSARWYWRECPVLNKSIHVCVCVCVCVCMCVCVCVHVYVCVCVYGCMYMYAYPHTHTHTHTCTHTAG